jgi:hypothetical protein
VFDVWRLEDHLIPSGQARPRSITDVLPNCLTNIDAVAIDVRRGAVCEHQCLDGLRRRAVRLLHPPVTDPPALIPQLVHLLLLWEKYVQRGFEFDQPFLRALSPERGAPSAATLLCEAEEKLRERGRVDAPEALDRMRVILAQSAFQGRVHTS